MGFIEDLKKNAKAEKLSEPSNEQKKYNLSPNKVKGRRKLSARHARLCKMDVNLKSLLHDGEIIWDFIKYCELFKDSVSRSTVYNHRKKGFSRLSEVWQIKYLSFFKYYDLI